MKRSCAVKLTLVTSVAALLVQCDRRPSRYCVDETQNVVNDTNCDDRYRGSSFASGSYRGHSSGRYHWYYGGASGVVPNGTHLTGGSAVLPRGGFVTPSSSAGSGISRGMIGHAGAAASAHGGE